MLLIQLPETNLPASIVLFLVGAAGVWLIGSRLVVYADEIADRQRIGRAVMGLVFLAAATSMPEIITTIVAAVSGNASLVLGNLLGGITLQFAILAIADGFVVGVAITSFPRKTTTILEGVVLGLLMALLIATLTLNEYAVLGHVGLGSTFLAVCYLGAIALLRKHENGVSWVPVEVPEPGDVSEESVFVSSFPELGAGALNLRFLGLTCGLVLAAFLTVETAERIGMQTSMGSGFVGVTLLAGATSLPELSTTIAAVRLGAYTMAISNIFGSNLIMLALIWPADLLFLRGPILQEFEPVLSLALISGLIVTLVYVAGLLLRSRRNIFGLGYDSLAVLVISGVTLLLYWLRK